MAFNSLNHITFGDDNPLATSPFSARKPSHSPRLEAPRRIRTFSRGKGGAGMGAGSVGEVPNFASEELAEKNQCTPAKARRGTRALL